MHYPSFADLALLFQQMPNSMNITQSRLAFFGRTFHSLQFSTGSSLSPLHLPAIHLRRPMSFEHGLGKPADLCSYAMSFCPDLLPAISMSDLSFAFQTESVPSNEEYRSFINDQLDHEMSYVTSEQSFGNGLSEEPTELSHPEAPMSTEADIMGTHPGNARKKAKLRTLQDLQIHSEDKMETLPLSPCPHAAFANGTGVGEAHPTDILNDPDTNMDYNPKSTSYEDSVIATSALNAMLTDFNDLPTSWIDSD